jgi:hypothetical protein
MDKPLLHNNAPPQLVTIPAERQVVPIERTIVCADRYAMARPPLIAGAHWPRVWGRDIRVRWVKPAIETRPAARLRIVERYAY